MRHRLRSMLIVATIALLVIVCVALLNRPEQYEQPPPSLIPPTEYDRQILDLANQFVKQRGASDYAVPVRIEPHPTRHGSLVVIYWTPRRELALLGDRAVVVDPISKIVEFNARD